MPRAVRDAKLDSRAARERLRPRGKPYFRAIDPGLHLGYRRLKGLAGRWVVRRYAGEQSYETETIGTADDFSAANGVDVMDWPQAQAEARRRRDGKAVGAGAQGPFTVADAIQLYIKALRAEGRNATDTERRANAMILPSLGQEIVADLTTDRLREWLTELAAALPRARTARGEPQRYRALAAGEDRNEAVRRRRSTANRHFAILRAALTNAWREKRAVSDEAWRRVKSFKNVAAARVRYLTIAEGVRLINAGNGEFRRLVQAALQTGARYSELARLQAGDFNPDSGTLAIRRSKTGKARHVVLTEEGVALFAELCAGRRGDEIILRQPNGEPWGPSNQTQPLYRACHRAGIAPAINFHCLRHTYASHAVMNGAPLHVVAHNLGHADTRMVEKHYGHLAPSYVADEIRRAAPRFALGDRSNVTPLIAPKAR
jgi:integrase